MQKLLSLCLLVAVCGASCFVTRTTIGDGPVGKRGKTDVFSRTKRLYLFAGLVPLGLTQPALPEHGNFQVKTAHNIGDVLISTLTFGIITSQTTKILVKEGEGR